MSLIKLDKTKLPAHLVGRKSNTMDALFQAIGSGGVTLPHLSVRGKVFRVKTEAGEVVLKDSTGKHALVAVSVVIVGIKRSVDKAYYPDGYQEGVESTPACWSRNGEFPDPSITSPISASCTTCPYNAYYSAERGRGKRCTDKLRVVVTPYAEGRVVPFEGHRAFVLAVPPTSFRNLREYGKTLAAHGLSVDDVVTTITFDPDETWPVLQFDYAGYLTEDGVAEIAELAASPEVQDALRADAPTAPVPSVRSPESVAPTAPAKPTPEPAKPASAVATESAADQGFDVDSLTAADIDAMRKPALRALAEQEDIVLDGIRSVDAMRTHIKRELGLFDEAAAPATPPAAPTAETYTPDVSPEDDFAAINAQAAAILAELGDE